MRIVWTLARILVVLAIAIPVTLVVLGTTIGILGVLIGLFKLTLKFAVVALVGLGVFKLGRRLFGSTPPRYAKPVTEQLPPADPYYESAMRELDGEFGRSR